VFAGLAWALWTNRNRMAIEHHFTNKPSDVKRKKARTYDGKDAELPL
jgi:hypothetical protein